MIREIRQSRALYFSSSSFILSDIPEPIIFGATTDIRPSTLSAIFDTDGTSTLSIGSKLCFFAASAIS